ncbi:MAG: PEGA domain-containing protein [Planctomycetes bacterium]|nr:PEGA domain-containing protein [Planctomycetota bacterium]
MRALAVLPLLAASACTWWSSTEMVRISSDPLGARVFVDGQDTGRTTPVMLAIGGNFGRDHVVELRLPGHRPAARRLYQYTEGYTSKWIDGAYEDVLPPLPFFWTAGDFFVPFGVRGAMVPGDLHVKLYRDDEPLLGFELLAARAAGQAPAPKLQ